MDVRVPDELDQSTFVPLSQAEKSVDEAIAALLTPEGSTNYSVGLDRLRTAVQSLELFIATTSPSALSLSGRRRVVAKAQVLSVAVTRYESLMNYVHSFYTGWSAAAPREEQGYLPDGNWVESAPGHLLRTEA